MSDSKRLQFLRAVKALLSTIRTNADFNTDAGANVFMGETVKLGPSDPTSCLSISVLDDDPQNQHVNVASVMAIEVQAHVKADLNEPILIVEQVIADIKVALEQEDRSLGGIVQKGSGLQRGGTRIIERPEGSEFMGAGIVYRGLLVEKWGNP